MSVFLTLCASYTNKVVPVLLPKFLSGRTRLIFWSLLKQAGAYGNPCAADAAQHSTRNTAQPGIALWFVGALEQKADVLELCFTDIAAVNSSHGLRAYRLSEKITEILNNFLKLKFDPLATWNVFLRICKSLTQTKHKNCWFHSSNQWLSNSLKSSNFNFFWKVAIWKDFLHIIIIWYHCMCTYHEQTAFYRYRKTTEI